MQNVKFLNKFFLFSGYSKHGKLSLEQENESEVVKQAQCEQWWPVCLYDFTFKNSCHEYFAYWQEGSPFIMVNYFDLIDEPKHLPIHKDEFSTLVI